jgi:hypothetical protein
MTTSTYITRLVTGIALTITAATAIVPAAFAGGEPKNQAPFTNLASGRVLAEGVKVKHATAAQVISGERKNEVPFTVRVSSSGAQLVISGEQKNQMPFTRK